MILRNIDYTPLLEQGQKVFTIQVPYLRITTKGRSYTEVNYCSAVFCLHIASSLVG